MPKDTLPGISLLRQGATRLVYLLRSLESRWNRPLIPRGSVGSFLKDWEGGEGVRQLAGPRPRLLVTITTYRRPTELRELIEALARYEALRAPDCWLCILNDRSDSDYGAAREALARSFPGRYLWLDARERMGKPGFWRTHQTILLAARAARCEFLLSLQDDVQLAPRFADRLWEAWGATAQDPARRVLYLFSSANDNAQGTWVDFPRMAAPPGVPARRTDWFDLQGFLIDREGLALLRYWVVPITAWRWRKNTVHSSGVGRQLTRRLFGRATTWQCDPPLLFHGASPSEMNPEARQRNPLDNRALFPGADPTP